MAFPLLSRPVFVLLLATLLLTVSSSELKGLQCSDHPFYTPGFKGELIRSWSYTRKTDNMYFTDSGYHPRYSKHAYAPVEDLSSTKYHNLDYFGTFLAKDMPDKYITMSFNRPAKVYLLVNGHDGTHPRVGLPGWRSEGWVVMVKGKEEGKVDLGVAKPMLFFPPSMAYVFSKVASEEIVLPSKVWVGRNLRGLDKDGYYNVLVAEADGSRSKAPLLPSGRTANAGSRCPKEVHDLWMAPARDRRDPQMARRRFRTNHPLWDPCFWCGFAHEHGSMPKQLMGYEPLFGYVALKNGNESESHNGFKSMVLDVGEHYLYYGFHAKLSDPRRFFARHHTVVIAVAEKKSKELVLELSYKADFGFLAARSRDHKLIPLRPIDNAIQEQQKAKGLRDAMRNINVINPSNPDPRYSYKNTGADILKGQYEQWVAPLMCADLSQLRGPQLDVKQPQTGLRYAGSGGAGMIKLGRELHGAWRQHVGVNRDVRFQKLAMSFELCGLGKETKDGVFYTDVYGKRRLPGPGKGAVRQFIKPGTDLFFEGGIFMADDTWLGLQKAGKISEMRDVSNSVDASVN